MTLLLGSAGYAEDDVVIQRHENIIAAAERQGVGHVVYTSLTGTGDHLAFALAHRWTERRLQRGSMAWTILRNGLNAELIGALAAPINGTIYAPSGQVASRQLPGKTLPMLRLPSARHPPTMWVPPTNFQARPLGAWLTSPRPLRVEYAPTSLAQERTKLNAAPLLPFQPAMLLSIYSASAAGFLDAPQSDLAKLLASSPRDSLTLAVAEALGKSDTY